MDEGVEEPTPRTVKSRDGPGGSTDLWCTGKGTVGASASFGSPRRRGHT